MESGEWPPRHYRIFAFLSTMPTYLAIDTGSPLVSVAVGCGSDESVSRTLELRQSSERLLATIESALVEAECALSELDGLVALRGPGSFTGLRIGLATALGLHQAIGIAATGLETLETQVRAVGESYGTNMTIISVVDAMKGDWFVQRFRAGSALDVARRVSAGEMSNWRVDGVVGFGASKLCAAIWNGDGPLAIESPPLAVAALSMAKSLDEWDSTLLSRPIYFRGPAARPLAAPLA